MKKITLTFITLAFFASSCNQATQRQVQTANNEIFCEKAEEIICENIPEKNEIDDFFRSPLIGNTIGFVIFDSKAIFENRVDTLNKIEMLNDDGTIWHSLYSDFPDFTEEMHNELFRPLYFDPHAIRLAMRSIDKSENYYTIVVNEEKNLIKRVRKHSNLLFYTVEESVESSWLCTDVRINPLRKYPNDDAEVIEIDYRTDLFDPIERKGEWVKVRDVLAYEAETVGWIRWRKGDRFMVWVWCSI